MTDRLIAVLALLAATGCKGAIPPAELGEAKAELGGGSRSDAVERAGTVAEGFARACEQGDAGACEEAIAYYWHGAAVIATDAVTSEVVSNTTVGADEARARALFAKLVDIEWRAADQRGTIGSYQSFSAKYPHTPEAHAAEAKLDGLFTAESERKVQAGGGPELFLELAERRPAVRARLVPLVARAGLRDRPLPYLARVRSIFASAGDAGATLARDALAEEDERAWTELDRSNLSAVKMYTRTYPKGRHALEARTTECTLAFRDARQRDGASSIEAFLASYPDAPNRDEAEALVRQRKADDAKRRDDAAWAATDRDACTSGKGDGCADVERYLERAPDGGHAGEARAMLAGRKRAVASAAAAAASFCQEVKAGLKAAVSCENFCKARGGERASCVARCGNCL